jgi:hypothetical protein
MDPQNHLHTHVYKVSVTHLPSTDTSNLSEILRDPALGPALARSAQATVEQALAKFEADLLGSLEATRKATSRLGIDKVK